MRSKIEKQNNKMINIKREIEKKRKGEKLKLKFNNKKQKQKN